MSTYMIQASFTSDAWANLCKHPEDRGAVVAEHMRAFGGKMLSYYCFGSHDVVIIIEAPGDAEMMAALANAASAGHLLSSR